MLLAEDKLRTEEGIDIFYCKAVPDNAKAIVLLLHGYGNHYTQMEPLFEPLYNSGYGIYAYDHRGHGRSCCKRGDIGKFEDFLSDLNYFIKYIKIIHSNPIIYTVGHSMGGLISFIYGLLYLNQIKGQIFTAPALGAPCGTRYIPDKFYIAANKIASNIKVYPVITRSATRNRIYKKACEKDPLCLKYSTVGFYYEFLYTGIQLSKRNLSMYRLPCLILHGKGDKIIPFRHSIRTYDSISSKDKELILYEKMYHELLHEPEKDIIIDKIVDWLNKRTSDIL